MLSINGLGLENRARDFCIPRNFWTSVKTCSIPADVHLRRFTGFSPSIFLCLLGSGSETVGPHPFVSSAETYFTGKTRRATVDALEGHADAVGSLQANSQTPSGAPVCSHSTSCGRRSGGMGLILCALGSGLST